MNALRTLLLHGSTLVVSAGLAYAAWSKVDEGDEVDSAELVEVWPGKPAELKSVAYSTDEDKVTVEIREDDAGAYCLVNAEKQRAAVAPNPPEKPDAKPTAERTTKQYVSVTGCEKLRKALAPLLAVRSIGVVPKDRFGEFGLDDPKGNFTVALGGAERRLTFGGMTPGGGDFYALEPGSGRVYAIAGETVRLLEYAESRLAERELHNFEANLVERVEIAVGGKHTSLVRMSGKVDGWARASTPTQADETAGNWMSKLGRLRLSEFKEKLEPGAKLVVRVDYRGASAGLGFVELYRVGEGTAAQYWAKSETTRWYGSVLRSVAEQLERDLASVAK